MGAVPALRASQRAALRAVWVRGSWRYQPADRYLIPAAAWPARRDAALTTLGLPARARERLAQLAGDIDARVNALDRALTDGDVAVDVQGRRAARPSPAWRRTRGDHQLAVRESHGDGGLARRVSACGAGNIQDQVGAASASRIEIRVTDKEHAASATPGAGTR